MFLINVMRIWDVTFMLGASQEVNAAMVRLNDMTWADMGGSDYVSFLCYFNMAYRCAFRSLKRNRSKALGRALEINVANMDVIHCVSAICIIPWMRRAYMFVCHN